MKRRIVTEMLILSMLSCATVSATETLVGVSSGMTKETTEETEVLTEAETEKQKQEEPNGWKVCIDPGHQGSWVDMSAMEPSAPGSSEMKARATTGTSGRYSGLNEYELNLDVSKVLQEELEMRGYEVVMTREDHDTAISNRERAELATEEKADILVRIHANGSEDESLSGALTMVPSPENPYVGHMYEECYELGDVILEEYCEATGFTNLGVGYYDNMSGINWSTIPVTILEMGYMSNPDDDLTMADETFWPVMADGIANGIDRYFEKKTPVIKETQKETETEKEKSEEIIKAEKTMNALHDELEESMAVKASSAESWAAAAVDLSTGAMCVVNDGKKQAASLIKLYIAGAVYERYDELTGTYGKDSIDSLLYSMITVSDNTAANTLTNYLGDGDDATGRTRVTEYCEKNGYENTVMGRMLLAPKDNGDNITSVSDCAEFLTKAYNNEIAHSEDILNLLKHQERRHKIPSGLPEGVESGNKTGELDDVENDAAIIFTEPAYVLCIMSEYLYDVWDAQQDIKKISTEVFRFAQSQLK